MSSWGLGLMTARRFGDATYGKPSPHDVLRESIEHQRQAREWLESQPDIVTCKQGGARMTLRACARRIAAINQHVRADMTDETLALRTRMTGCDECEHGPSARKLLSKQKQEKTK